MNFIDGCFVIGSINTTACTKT